MAMRQKPPGMEKWTWDEINARRKMSKSEKRYRRLAENMGATKGDKGEIQPPLYNENPGYWHIFLSLLLLAIIALFFTIFSMK